MKSFYFPLNVLMGCLYFFGISPLFAQDPNFHIYLAIGQSNMYGSGAIENQDKQGISPRFKNLSSVNCTGRSVGQWLDATPPLSSCGSGLSVIDYFGRTMVEKLPADVSVGVAVVAVPGTKIELFDKDGYQDYLNSLPPDGQYIKNYANSLGGNPYARILQLGIQAKEEGVIKGILLHQGESNNGEGKAWTAKVKKIYEDLIADLGLDPQRVPLIAGELVGQAEGGACWYHNGSAIAELPKQIPNAHVVSSSGLAQVGDGLHFTSAAYRTFGARYAEAMLAAIDTTPLIVIPASRDSVFNGGFDLGSAGWTLNQWAGSAVGSIVNGEYKLDVKSIGTDAYQIQLIQAGIRLQKDKTYEISFDAYADANRTLEVNVELDVSPWTSYLSQKELVNLTTVKKTYTFQFTMNEPSDEKGRISFNAGGATGVLYLDRIQIKEVQPPVSILKKNKWSGWGKSPNYDLLGRLR